MSSRTKTSVRSKASGSRTTAKTKTKPAEKATGKASAKSAVKAAAKTVEKAVPAEETRVLKKHLIEKVALRSGLRKNEVRPVLDALLEEIGGNLEENAQMILQPLGKIVVKQAKETDGATVYTCRIRRSGLKSD